MGYCLWSLERTWHFRTAFFKLIMDASLGIWRIHLLVREDGLSLGSCWKMNRGDGKARKLPGSKVLKRFPLGERQASPKKCDWGNLWILWGAGKSLLLLLSPCPAQVYGFGSVACSSYSLLLSPFSAWLSGATLSPSPSALCLPSSLLHFSQHSSCTHPNQKQHLCGRSIQNPEHTYGQRDVEKQSEDCWLGVSSSTLQRKKWHFSVFQNSMTTFECPNATVHMWQVFSFVTGKGKLC